MFASWNIWYHSFLFSGICQMRIQRKHTRGSNWVRPLTFPLAWYTHSDLAKNVLAWWVVIYIPSGAWKLWVLLHPGLIQLCWNTHFSYHIQMSLCNSILLTECYQITAWVTGLSQSESKDKGFVPLSKVTKNFSSNWCIFVMEMHTVSIHKSSIHTIRSGELDILVTEIKLMVTIFFNSNAKAITFANYDLSIQITKQPIDDSSVVLDGRGRSALRFLYSPAAIP